MTWEAVARAAGGNRLRSRSQDNTTIARSQYLAMKYEAEMEKAMALA